jgi:hypothetical protein
MALKALSLFVLADHDQALTGATHSQPRSFPDAGRQRGDVKLMLGLFVTHEHHGHAAYDLVDHTALVADLRSVLSWHRPTPPR